MRTILFRVDAYAEIGLGHLIRSLAIAKTIQSKYPKHEVVFISDFDEKSKKIIGDSEIRIIQKNKDEGEEKFIYHSIRDTGAEAIFFDIIYPYAQTFIKKLRSSIRIIMFHNICEGSFEADQFILPSIHTENRVLYDERWNRGYNTFYHGSEFVVINESVKKLKRVRRKKEGLPLEVVISTGGSDPKGVLLKVLEWINDSNISGVSIKALKGANFIHADRLSKLAERLSNNIRVVEFDYRHYKNADLAICTFGVSTYELLFLGIPLISIGHAEPNAKGSKIIEERYKALVNVGQMEHLDKEFFILTLNNLLDNVEERVRLQNASSSLIDGKGIERITSIICGLN